MPPIRDDDPLELRQRLFGSPAVVAENAMRLAWGTQIDVTLLNEQVKSTSGRLLDLEGRIMGSLGRIEHRLGIVERKPSSPMISSNPSQRPVSYHDLSEALAKALPEVERRQTVAWWMGLIDGFKNAFREGLKKGAAGAVAALVVAGLLLAAGYFLRDCAHAVVKTGNSNAIPRIRAVE